MRSRSLFPGLVAVVMIIFTSCHSRNQGRDAGLPASVVTNPNSASGETSSDLPILTFDKTEHDFGKIVEGETVSCEFKFTNTGKADLVILNVSTSCGCTVPSYPKNAILPGESGVIKVAFNSHGKRGQQNKNVVVNANTQPTATTLRIKAKVVNPEDE
jgi:hypothetical protein